jgi:hypothetical protein
MMRKNTQDRNRVSGQNEGGEGMKKENMPKDVKGMDPKKGEQGGEGQQGQTGQENWQGQNGDQSRQPHKGDQMNRPRDTDEDMDDRKRRPA